MQNTISLNGLYADYSAGLLGKREFEGEIFKVIQKNVHNLPKWEGDDCDEYLSWLYPRISQAISTYRETGSSFETYIGSLIRMTSKEYRSRKVHSYLAESAAWTTIAPDMHAYEEAPEYYGAAVEMHSKLNNPRQLLILLLKCCYYVSDDFLEKAAPALGIQPETLNGMITRLKEFKNKRGQYIDSIRERVNYQFCRCIFYEKKLKGLTENGIAAQRVKQRLERGLERLAKLRKKLAHKFPAPSNQQIAELMGISKGTVDSVMYKFRSRYVDEQEIIMN